MSLKAVLITLLCFVSVSSANQNLVVDRYYEDELASYKHNLVVAEDAGNPELYPNTFTDDGNKVSLIHNTVVTDDGVGKDQLKDEVSEQEETVGAESDNETPDKDSSEDAKDVEISSEIAEKDEADFDNQDKNEDEESNEENDTTDDVNANNNDNQREEEESASSDTGDDEANEESEEDKDTTVAKNEVINEDDESSVQPLDQKAETNRNVSEKSNDEVDEANSDKLLDQETGEQSVDETSVELLDDRARPCASSFSLTSFVVSGILDESDSSCYVLVRRATENMCKLSLHHDDLSTRLIKDAEECAGVIVTITDKMVCLGREIEDDGEEDEVNDKRTGGEIDYDDTDDKDDDERSGLMFDFNTQNLIINVTQWTNQSVEFDLRIRQIDCSALMSPNETSSDEYSDDGDSEVPLLITPPSESTLTRGDQEIDGRQRQGERCNRIFRGAEFVLQSPNYPFPYPPDLDCFTKVERMGPNICSLELRFDEFKVQPSQIEDECANDYLEVSDDEPLSRTMRYCGSFTGIRLLEIGPTGKKFRFHTNSAVSDVGYSILVKQVSCQFPQPTTSTTTVRPTITTTTTTSTTTTTDVTQRTLPPLPTTTTRRPLTTTRRPLTTTTTRRPLTTTTRRPTITTTRRPFTTTRRPTITTTKRPTITTTRRPTITTTRRPTTTTRPRNPFLTTTTPRNPFLTTTTPRNPFLTTTRPGPPSPRSCSSTLSTPARVVSPGFALDLPYPADAFCRYRVVLADRLISTCYVKVEFITFDLEISVDCRKDYLQIRQNRVCGFRSGSSTLYPVTPGTGEISMTFSSDGANRADLAHRGFDVLVTQVPCEDLTPTTTTTFRPPFTTGFPTFRPTPSPTFRPPFTTTRFPTIHPTFRPPFTSTNIPTIHPTFRPPFTTTHVPTFHPPTSRIPVYVPTTSIRNPFTTPPPHPTRPNQHFPPPHGSHPPFRPSTTARPPYQPTSGPVHGSGQYEPPANHGSGQYKPAPGNHGSGQYEPPLNHGSGQYEPPANHGSAQYKPPLSHGSGQYEQPTNHGPGQYEPPANHGTGQYDPPSRPSYSVPKPSYGPPRPSYNAAKPSYHVAKPSYQGRPSYRRPQKYRAPQSHHHQGKKPNKGRSPRILEQLVDAKIDFISSIFNLFRKPKKSSSQKHKHPQHSSGYGAPKRPVQTAYGAPKPGYGAPKPSYGAPKPTYGAPKPSYGAPKPSYGASKPSYGAPKPSYSAPTSGYGAPSQASRAPTTSYDAPSGGYQAPDSTQSSNVHNNREPRLQNPPNQHFPLGQDVTLQGQEKVPSQEIRIPNDNLLTGNSLPSPPHSVSSALPHQQTGFSSDPVPPLPVVLPENTPPVVPQFFTNEVNQINNTHSITVPNNSDQDFPPTPIYFATSSEPLVPSSGSSLSQPIPGSSGQIPAREQPTIGLTGQLPKGSQPSIHLPVPPNLSKNALDIVQCGASTQAEEFLLASPNYPADYPHGADCTFRVLPAKEGEFCLLAVTFDDFIVEESAGCRDDYLQIGKETLCGQHSNVELLIPRFDDPEWLIRFRSDSRGATRGFRLLAKQIPCFDGTFGSTSTTPAPPPLPIRNNAVVAANRRCNANLSPFEINDARSSIDPRAFGEGVDACEFLIYPIEGACRVDFDLSGLTFGPICKDFFAAIDGIPFCAADEVTSIHNVRFGPQRDPVRIRLHYADDFQRVGRQEWRIYFNQAIC